VRSYIDQIEQGQRLLAELRAIALWDRDFSKRTRDDAHEVLGAFCRVRRCLEIVSELNELISKLNSMVVQKKKTQQRVGSPKRKRNKVSSFLGL
jgi:hypothetical protein